MIVCNLCGGNHPDGECDGSGTIARLTTELSAARAMLAKATQFAVGSYDVRRRACGWVIYDDMDAVKLGRSALYDTPEEAVAAAEKAQSRASGGKE